MPVLLAQKFLKLPNDAKREGLKTKPRKTLNCKGDVLTDKLVNIKIPNSIVIIDRLMSTSVCVCAGETMAYLASFLKYLF